MSENNFITIYGNEQLFIYRDGIYKNPSKSYVAEICRQLVPDITEHQTNEVIFFIKSSTFIEQDIINIDKTLIWLDNGILNIETGELKDFDSKYISTIKLPIRYDKDATCPLIMKFLKEIVVEEDIPLIQEMIGYCLLKEYPIHKAFMFIGPGANGKSTLLNVIQKFLGEDNTTSVSLSELSYNRFAASRLYGKLANIFADIPATKLVFTGQFKMATGQDIMTYEKKHQDATQFRNYAKLIFSANQLPQTSDTTEAFFRRWIIINFPNIFTDNADINLLLKLTTPEELSGLFNWVLEGLKRVLVNKTFSYSKTQNEVKEQYIMLSDSLRSFCLRCCSKDVESYVPKDEFYDAYLAYCEELGLEVKTKALVGRELPTILPFITNVKPSIDGKRVKCWGNLKVGVVIEGIEKESIQYDNDNTIQSFI